MTDLSFIQPEWLNRKQAAEYIYRKTGVRLSVQALAARATSRSTSARGAGPPYRIWCPNAARRGGRGRFAVYRPADLDAWIETQLHEPPQAEDRHLESA